MQDEAAHFFQHQGVPQHSQPFDLSPLNRALGPTGSREATPPPPAWAQAFAQQNVDMQSHRSGSPAEQEAMHRAFQQPGPSGGGGVAHAEWSGDFHSRMRNRQGRDAEVMRMQQASAPTQAGGLYATGQARLRGTGFGGGNMMMGGGLPHMAMSDPGIRHQQHQQPQQDIAVSTGLGELR